MRKYSLSDFADVPIIRAQAPDTSQEPLELVEVSSFGASVDWNDALIALYETETPEDRSFAMMEAAYTAAELAWSDSHILSLIWELDERWGKYSRRPDHIREKYLKDIIGRARTKVGYEGIDTSVPTGFLEKHHAAVIDESEVLGFNDFLARTYPIDWILTDLLPKAGAGIIAGWPGAGKTTLSLQLAANLALGQTFLRWKSTGPARVLFLSLEMAAPPLHLFVSNSREQYNDKELKQLNQNLLLAPFGVPLHFDREEGYERLTGLIEKHEPDVIIVDSLSMVTPKDLTDEEAMKNLFDGLAVVRQETGTSFVIIHHNRKKAADAQKSKGVELSDIYGSTYISAKVDFVLNVTKMDEPNTIQLTTLKNRLGPEPEAFDLIRSNMKFTDPLALGGFFPEKDMS